MLGIMKASCVNILNTSYDRFLFVDILISVNSVIKYYTLHSRRLRHVYRARFFFRTISMSHARGRVFRRLVHLSSLLFVITSAPFTRASVEHW